MLRVGAFPPDHLGHAKPPPALAIETCCSDVERVSVSLASRIDAISKIRSLDGLRGLLGWARGNAESPPPKPLVAVFDQT